MMPIVIKKYYKIDSSRIISNDNTDYIFRKDKDTGNGWLDISELSIFKNPNLVPILEKTSSRASDPGIYMNPKREGHINEIFLFKTLQENRYP